VALGGGKTYLARRIIALFPPHLHYVEPFAGGLAVLLARDPEGVSECVNDKNKELTGFWRVLQDPEQFAALSRMLEATPPSEVEFHRAQELRTAQPPCPVLRAWAFFVAVRQSMSARMKHFTPMSRTRTRRGMNELASAWMGAVDGLGAVHARLRRVVIFDRDALDVIRQQDGEKTLFYLDPPYLHETRATPDEYAHEMTDQQHQDLLHLLTQIKGKFLLSGYRSATYDAVASLWGWHRHDIEIPNHSAGGDTKRVMTESLWANYPFPEEA
jgi:DNA adenine methylase